MSSNRNWLFEAMLNAGYVYPFKDANELLKLAVWSKGAVIPDFDSNVWRRDICGKVMKYSEHGNTASEHGWEIDHIYPRAKNGTDALTNLQPLNWKVNRSKGDTYPYSCG